MTNLPPAMPGRLIYLMGPSGAGKDSLIGAAREILSARGCRIARRVITRSSTRGEEGAQCVSATRFAQLERAGAFAMSWRAHGMAYGIPTQIDDWLAAGWYVLVNGSRSYWPEALRRYPRAQGVLALGRPGGAASALAGTGPRDAGGDRGAAGAQRSLPRRPGPCGESGQQWQPRPDAGASLRTDWPPDGMTNSSAPVNMPPRCPSIRRRRKCPSSSIG